MMKRIVFLAFLSLLLSLSVSGTSCSESEMGGLSNSDDDDDNDNDNDNDNNDDNDNDNSSSDGDVDSDADSDSDTDSDVVKEPCPENSGWPCPCTGSSCDNGDLCIHNLLWSTNPETDPGYCSEQNCSSGTCSTTDYTGTPTCDLDATYKDVPTPLCHLTCTDADDCPPGMECRYESNISVSVCHP